MRRPSAGGFRALSAGIVTGLALSVAACAADDGTSPDVERVSAEEVEAALQEPATITFWTWLPGAELAAQAFMDEYPAITVVIENPAGAADQQPQRVRTAIEAGTGAPDVVHFNQTSVADFVLTGDLLDLTAYGMDELADDFVAGAWSNVSVGDGVYGLPQDIGPMAGMYREDLFAQAGIDFPRTWEEFADAAAIIKESTGSYIANFGFLEYNILPLQGGVPMFDWDGGESVHIAIDNPSVEHFANYWQELIDADLIATDPDFTDTWFQGMASGKYASWMTPAWGPIFVQETAANTSGLWRLAPLPHWEGDSPASPPSGGSATVVLDSTEHPHVAAAFVRWLNHDPEATRLLTNDLGLFPATVALLEDQAWLDREFEFFGGQQANQVFAESAATLIEVRPVPFQGYAATVGGDTVFAALASGAELYPAFQQWQERVVVYALDQGFTVTE